MFHSKLEELLNNGAWRKRVGWFPKSLESKENARRQREKRKQQKKVGRKGRLLFLTKEEKEAVDLFIRDFRKKKKEGI